MRFNENMAEMTQSGKKNLFLITGGLVLFADQVSACSLCVMAAADKLLPPIFLWCIIAMAFFMLSSITCSYYDIKIWGVSRVFKSLLILLFSLLAGVIILGPLPSLFLGLITAASFVRSSYQKQTDNLENPGHKAFRRLGYVAFLIVLLAAGKSAQIYMYRTPAQYVVAWGSTGPGRGEFAHLRSQEPESISAYIYILKHGRGNILVESAQRIAEMGRASDNRPVIEEALQRAQTSMESDLVISELKKVLQQ